MEWITPEYEEYTLSAEMTAYAGQWPGVEAGEGAAGEDDPEE